MSVWLVDAIGEESIDRLVSRKRFIFRFPLARAIPPENSEINSSIVICFSLLFLFNLESKSRIVRFSVERFFFIDSMCFVNIAGEIFRKIFEARICFKNLLENCFLEFVLFVV